MQTRTKRRRPFIKAIAATGLFAACGAGAYQFIGPNVFSGQADTVDSAVLDEAQNAWASDAYPQPPAAAGSALPEAPEPRELVQPLVAESRYGASSAPLPLLQETTTIARGQSPSEDDFEQEELEPNVPNPWPVGAQQPINPLRANSQADAAPQSSPAREAFGQPMPTGQPPAAVAAFGSGARDPQVQPAGAVEPIADEPPAPLSQALPAGLPMAPVGPLEELPPFEQGAPAPFTAGGADLPPLPDSGQPNPLREHPAEAAPLIEEASTPLSMEPRELETELAPMPTEPAATHTALAEPQRTIEPQGAQPVRGMPIGGGRPGERSLEGQQQPTIAIQKFAPAEIQVGKPCKFLVKVRNVGQRPAMDVVVHDQAPSGVQLTATQPRAEVSGDRVAWELGDLAPGEERVLEMEVTPVEEGELGSVATVTFSADASVRTTCTKPQLAIRMVAPSKVMVGGEQTIQIEIKNPGTGDATNVVILENVPENLRHAAGPVLEFAVGTLHSGETRRLQLNMVAESPGRVVNVLTAQADGNLQVEQKVEFEVVAPDLQIAVDGPKRRYLERPATYTVKIGNPGTAAARDVKLVTKLPQGMKFVNANNLGEYDPATHAVYWSLAELPSGESGAVQLTTLPIAPGEHMLQVQGQALNGLEDKTTHGTTVEGIAALKFTVLDLEDPIEVGGETEYEVRVANQGTKAATNVRVQVTAPSGMRVISAAGDARHRVQGGLIEFEPIRQLMPRSELTFRVRVQGAQPGDHRLVVEVGSDDLAQPVRKEESTRVFGDE
ncbi:MAG: DUF11 domain-containing protein [Planctomycetales bacterium]|nr:DUF11 domain-containing protein [Planctomycetales bacterium]